MASEQGQVPWAPVGFAEEPEAQTQSQLKKPNRIEDIATDLEEDSCLDLCIWNSGFLSKSPTLIIVYIRPAKKVLEKSMRKGGEITTFTFRGVRPSELKRLFLNATSESRFQDYIIVSEDFFEYIYRPIYKSSLYKSIGELNKLYRH